jgi:hypothetical protein
VYGFVRRDKASVWPGGKGENYDMAQALDRLTAIKEKVSAAEISDTVAEIDAKDFQRARRDPKLRSFAKAADERLGKLRAAGRID